MLSRISVWPLVSLLAVLSWSILTVASEIPAPPPTQYHQQLRSLQTAFCGAQKQDEIRQSVRKLVEERLAAMALAQREKLHAEHVVDEVMKTLHATFHVEELCLEHSHPPLSRIKGLVYGFGGGLLLKTYGVETAIHELGHAVTGGMCWCQTNPEIHVVKFDIIARFMSDLFSGHASLQEFGEMINPFTSTSSGGVAVLGWTKFHFPRGVTQLTPFGAALGSNGSQVFMLLGGVLFTSIAQITGMIIGLNLRHRYPTLGYAMITASLLTYSLEMVNWVSISMGSAAAMGGSDLFRAAALLGVAPAVISGSMVGISAAVIATYVIVAKYRRQLKELRIAAQSLVDEGFLAAIKGEETNLLDELLARYPRKEQFDRRIEKMKKHIEEVTQLRIKNAVASIEKQLANQAEGKDPSATSWRDWLPDGETFKKLGQSFHHWRQVKKFKDELHAFHRYITKSAAPITLAHQDQAGKDAIYKVMSGKFAYETENLIGKNFLTTKQRNKQTQSYLTTHPILPLTKMVSANRKRIIANEHYARESSTLRWEQLITVEQFNELSDKKGFFFKLAHIFYPNYIADLRYDVQLILESFTRAKMNNHLKEMTALAKKLLKSVFMVSKEQRDIPAAEAVISRYVEAMQGQERIHIKKRWFLDVVDQKSCAAEIDFLCTLGGIFHRANLPQEEPYVCPLSTKDSCFELNSDPNF